jgi:hypothetical protein
MGIKSFKNSNLTNVTLRCNMGAPHKNQTLNLSKECFCNNADTLKNISIISDGNISLAERSIGREAGFNVPRLDTLTLQCNNLAWVRMWGESASPKSIGIKELTLNVQSTTKKSESGVNEFLRGGASLKKITINGGTIEHLFSKYKATNSDYSIDSGVKTDTFCVNIFDDSPVHLNSNLTIAESFEIHFAAETMKENMLTIHDTFQMHVYPNSVEKKVSIYNDDGTKWFSNAVVFTEDNEKGLFGTDKYDIELIQSDISYEVNISTLDLDGITG